MTTPIDDPESFYEHDESVEKIQEAFARGEKSVTSKRRDLNQLAAAVVEKAAQDLPVYPVVFRPHIIQQSKEQVEAFDELLTPQ